MEGLQETISELLSLPHCFQQFLLNSTYFLLNLRTHPTLGSVCSASGRVSTTYTSACAVCGISHIMENLLYLLWVIFMHPLVFYHFLFNSTSFLVNLRTHPTLGSVCLATGWVHTTCTSAWTNLAVIRISSIMESLKEFFSYCILFFASFFFQTFLKDSHLIYNLLKSNCKKM